MGKIHVEDLYKVFGPNPLDIVPMLKAGKTKDQIMREMEHSVGVAGASFSVNEGEILVIMGLSGSGKSTLLRCINRLIEPTFGVITVDGQDILALNKKSLRHFRQKHFGMVFQNFALLPHRTVLRNVEYGLEIQKIDKKLRHQLATEALEQVGLEGWGASLPEQLSGGMQQRVGLARALALNADIMLMDEAFSALDPLIRRNMQDELLSLQKNMRKTIIFISHDLDEALKLGDRIVLMKAGSIIQEGTPVDILTNPADDYVKKFVEEVDLSKVITAETVMMDPGEMAFTRTDSPDAALIKMEKLNASTIFARKNGRLDGIITAQDASKARKDGEKSLERVVKRNIPKVTTDTTVKELFRIMAEIDHPLAVVDGQQYLKGVVDHRSLLGALSNNLRRAEKKGDQER